MSVIFNCASLYEPSRVISTEVQPAKRAATTVTIVTSYAENIKNNVEEICNTPSLLRHPFLSFQDVTTLEHALIREFTELPAGEISAQQAACP